jgi:hypothetical protein
VTEVRKNTRVSDTFIDSAIALRSYGRKAIPTTQSVDYHENLVLPYGVGIGGYGDDGTGSLLNISSGAWWNNSSVDRAFVETLRTISSASIFGAHIITITQDGCQQVRDSISQQVATHCFPPHLNLSSYWDFINFAASACTFYPCVRDYAASVDNTVFTETIINDTPIPSSRDESSTDHPLYYRTFHTPCVVDGVIYTLNNISSVPERGQDFVDMYVDNQNISIPGQCIYGLSFSHVTRLAEFMSDIISGQCNATGKLFSGPVLDTGGWNHPRCDNWAIQSLFNQGNASFDSINANMQAIAMAITADMRKKPGSMNGTQAFVEGTVWRTTVCTQFDWIWLSFPLALISLTTILLLIMCGKDSLDKQRIPAWKSSLLPLLFTGNELRINVAAGDMNTIIADTSKAVVSLLNSGRGWEFVVERPDDLGEEVKSTTGNPSHTGS